MCVGVGAGREAEAGKLHKIRNLVVPCPHLQPDIHSSVRFV